ncbi:hypothetical protein KSP35_16015 [Aquihabitans sp. G128]|uniref:hypothetical protein n=1 Tax=Aquihabitans sp. G128 TaxID=2849779 RepID=UPI001C2255E9|nr:hypothetical protein [Aquihabitans sp. G128]QXC59873.1 hypothetical protein KSP35_16015 [Aquihabitans sp. G128]
MPLAPHKERLDRLVSRVAAGRWWQVRTAIVGLVLGVLLAGTYPPPHFGEDAQWRYIIEHSRGSLFDPNIGPESREANLTFRFVPRLVGKVLFFDSPWAFVALQVVAAVVLLVVLAKLLDEALGDRRAAVVATVGTVGLWAVAGAWVDLRGNFDALAVLLLLVAMASRRPPIVFLVGLAATFTDERAVFALPIVAAWHLLRDDHAAERARRTWQAAARAVPWLPVGAALAAGVGHLAIRQALKARYGIHEGRNRSPGEPLAQLNNYPSGIWGALEGYWFLTVAGLATTWHRGSRLVVLGCVGCVAVTIVVAMSVFDISRSVVFLFPVVPFAALGLRHLPRRATRGLVWTAALVSLAWPLLYAADQATVNWAYPLPLLLVDHLRG